MSDHPFVAQHPLMAGFTTTLLIKVIEKSFLTNNEVISLVANYVAIISGLLSIGWFIYTRVKHRND